MAVCGLRLTRCPLCNVLCAGGVLVVCDPDNHRFQTFSTADGSFLGAFGIQGFGDGAFGGNRNGPFGVAGNQQALPPARLQSLTDDK